MFPYSWLYICFLFKITVHRTGSNQSLINIKHQENEDLSISDSNLRHKRTKGTIAELSNWYDTICVQCIPRKKLITITKYVHLKFYTKQYFILGDEAYKIVSNITPNNAKDALEETDTCEDKCIALLPSDPSMLILAKVYARTGLNRSIVIDKNYH